MLEKYYLKHKNTPIGAIVNADGIFSYRPIHEQARTLPHSLGYPIGLFEVNKNTKPWTANINRPAKHDRIVNWLSRRVFPPERPDAKRLLDKLGLNNYDMWEIIKKTKGAVHHDPYWISLTKDEPYKDYREGTPRATTIISVEGGLKRPIISSDINENDRIGPTKLEIFN